jgi:hypothetical protein
MSGILVQIIVPVLVIFELDNKSVGLGCLAGVSDCGFL